MKRHLQPLRPNSEQGSVLLVTMVFLLLFAIIAATVFRGSQTSVLAVGNMQWRSEAINATNEVISNILSDYNGFIRPALTHGLNAPGAPKSSFTSDVNGDGVTDIEVNVKKIECSYIADVKEEDLDPAKPEDQACMNSGGMNNTTFCSEVQFSVLLEARDRVSNAVINIEQGIGVRVSGVELCNF